jgi:nucleoside-diphosphate-sugar epimerase
VGGERLTARVRVLVTGGTGFVGSHSVKALRDAGHAVRLLVRSPGRIAPALRPHGLEEPEHVVGDVTDAEAVNRALDGCDAVLHAANVYVLDSRRAAEMLAVNPRGTELVLRAAHERGLDPIVHVSSTVVFLPSNGRVLTPDAPLGSPPGAYARSKVAAERVARELQGTGAPVVIVNPGGVLGPRDPHMSDFVRLAYDVLRGRAPFLPPGSTAVVDVRDVAAVHAAVLEPGRGPRRYLASAGNLSLGDFVAEARRLTGRRLPAVRVPGPLALASGRAADLMQRALPMRLPLDSEAPWLMIDGARVDASATERDLGVRFRPPAESLADTYRWLSESALVSRRQAGRLAAAAP